MWYVLWTKEGEEEKTRVMINSHIDHRLFTRCIVPYRKKREFHDGKSVIVQKLLFPSYVFIETDDIHEFAQQLQWYPGKNVILRAGDFCCPVGKEDEHFLTKMLNRQDVIEISEGYMDDRGLHVVSGPLKGYENHIKKVILRRNLAVLEMTLYDRKVETRLGLDLN